MLIRPPLRVTADLAKLDSGDSHGGIAVFIRELLAAIETSREPSFELTIAPSVNTQSRNLENCSAGNRFVPVSIDRMKSQVLYTPLGISVFYAVNIPRVTLAADVLHRDFPQTLPDWGVEERETWFDQMVHSSFRIQCNSEWVKQRVIHHYGIPESRLFVVYNAVQERLPPLPTRRTGERSVFLYPANAWAHKNHRTLLESYRIYQDRKGSDRWDLVLTGYKDQAMDQIEEFAAKLGLSGSVQFCGLLDMDKFMQVWARAGALIFPSLHEGFGIPVLEAMHLGIPVVAGKIGPIPEVAGDACLYTDPMDPEALAGAMIRIQSDLELRRHLIERGKLRATTFNMTVEAKKLLDVFVEAVRVFAESGIAPQQPKALSTLD